MTALPTVLLIGGVIIEIAIAGVFIVYFLGQSSFGVKWSAEALAAGRTGVYDAVLKIIREKIFPPAPRRTRLRSAVIPFKSGFAGTAKQPFLIATRPSRENMKSLLWATPETNTAG